MVIWRRSLREVARQLDAIDHELHRLWADLADEERRRIVTTDAAQDPSRDQQSLPDRQRSDNPP